MITTLTPNPSLDRTVSLPGELIRGGVNRLTGVTIEPGGKGLNVARVLVGAGQSVTAVLPAASHDPLLRVLGAVAADGLRVRPVDVAGSARINTAVTEPDGTTTKLNELGAGLSEEEIDAVEREAGLTSSLLLFNTELHINHRRRRGVPGGAHHPVGH